MVVFENLVTISEGGATSELEYHDVGSNSSSSSESTSDCAEDGALLF